MWQVESSSEAKKDADRVNQLNAELEKKSKALEDIEKQLEETKVHEAEVKSSTDNRIREIEQILEQKETELTSVRKEFETLQQVSNWKLLAEFKI